MKYLEQRVEELEKEVAILKAKNKLQEILSGAFTFNFLIEISARASPSHIWTTIHPLAQETGLPKNCSTTG
jgi:hypothetical protein